MDSHQVLANLFSKYEESICCKIPEKYLGYCLNSMAQLCSGSLLSKQPVVRALAWRNPIDPTTISELVTDVNDSVL